MSVALAASVGFISSASGQIVAPMATNVSGTTFNGDSAFSIVQSGTEVVTGGSGASFSFDRLADVAGGAYSNLSLVAVNVTLTMTTSGASLSLSNNGTSDFTGVQGDAGFITFTIPTFALGAITSNIPSAFDPSGSTGSIGTSSYLSNSPVISIDLEGETITPGNSISIADQGFTETQNRAVNEDWFGGYSGSGSFTFDIRSLFTVSFSGSGSDLTASQSFGNSTFTAEIEYVVIPEPGTIAAGFLGLGLIGFTVVRRIRRNKND